MVTEAQKRAVRKYELENYDFIKVRFKKGEKELIKSAAEASGKSINQFIADIVKDKIKA